MPLAPFYRKSDTVNDLVNGLTTMRKVTPCNSLAGLVPDPLLVPLLVNAPDEEPPPSAPVPAAAPPLASKPMLGDVSMQRGLEKNLSRRI
jgi:hypothetical protein